MKKLITTITLMFASFCVFAQSGVINKFPVNTISAERKDYVIKNKDAIIAEFQKYDMIIQPIYVNKNGVAKVWVKENKWPAVENKIFEQCFFSTLQVLSDTDEWKQFISASNFLVSNYSVYCRQVMTGDEYDTLKANKFIVPGSNNVKLENRAIVTIAAYNNDAATVKQIINSDKSILKYVVSNPIIMQYIDTQVIYDYLNDLPTLTEEQEKLKNRIFIKLYQKKMLGK